MILFSHRSYSQKGMALVEIVVGTAIISAGMIAAIFSFNTYLSYSLTHQKNVQASYLLEEALEGVSFLRDKGWAANIANLQNDLSYYMHWNGSYWEATTTPEWADSQFLRSITFSAVIRDASDRIATSGTLDTDTRKVTAIVSYYDGHATTTDSMSTYIANIYEN